jgi:hypothetical protein
LTGVENGFQISAARGGPVLLYIVSPEGIATVKGVITSLQRNLAKSTGGPVPVRPAAAAKKTRYAKRRAPTATKTG